MTISNFVLQIGALISPMSEQHQTVNVIYTMGSVLSIGLIYLQYKKKYKTMYFVYCYLMVRNGIRLLDLENTKPYKSKDWWSTILIMQSSVTLMTMISMCACFPSTANHKVVMTAFVPLSSFFCFCGVVGFQELMDDPSIIYG